MKVKEVPQDDEFFQPDSAVQLRDRTYALDENGQYQEVPSAGWKPKNEAIRFSWDNRGEEAEALRQKVIAGKCSPLVYHMAKSVMTPRILADYSGFSRREIHKFSKPKHFETLEQAELSRLAEAMNISVEELTSTD
ncbi:MAG: hypothetical protein WC377_08125 [Bacteroidales bacterium]|jgi:hypothetical protein|nr:hypothetical protein [Bacteroidales bacterium]MDD2823793.1 hypothetical protein [Bacteroidales bacterium]MDD3100523.1 hypothetical protein [Bacteroidales bacterium]MDD3639409.1 hypothetical protein [Bacteroidales bacterium]MDD3944008.1 hypothetical protein [Bacteroidales bacterium]